MTALAMAACGPGPDDSTVTVSDSAGVEIVTSSRPAWGEGEGWRLAAAPTVEIADFLRLVSATRLSDGRIAAADASSRIRIYGSDGRLLAAWGREGSGPGELTGIGSLQRLPDDSLWVYDGQAERVVVLSPTGEVARTLPIRTPGNEPLGPVARMSDGGMVAGAGWVSSQLPRPVQSGIHRDPASPVWILSPSGDVIDTLGAFPGLEVGVQVIEGGGMAVGNPPFGHTLSILPVGDRILIGTGDDLEVRTFDRSGRLLRVIRGPPLDLVPTAAEVQALRAALLATLRDPRTRALMERLQRQEAVPQRKAAYTRMLADPGGNLWLSPWESVVREGGDWTVFGPEGRLLGTVAVPMGFYLLEVGDDYLMGRWRNDLRTEVLRVYPLVK